jgi:hypothetical protein
LSRNTYRPGHTVRHYWFHLFEVQWSSGDDDFNQDQLDNAHVSCHSKPQVQVIV